MVLPQRDARERKQALGTVAEFVYQALVCGNDKYILDIMDCSDNAFVEDLRDSGLLEIHDALRNFVICDKHE